MNGIREYRVLREELERIEEWFGERKRTEVGRGRGREERLEGKKTKKRDEKRD